MPGVWRLRFYEDGLKERWPFLRPPRAVGSSSVCDLRLLLFSPPESKDEGSPPKLKCELCGRLDFAYKFKRSKRFCSMACAKR